MHPYVTINTNSTWCFSWFQVGFHVFSWFQVGFSWVGFHGFPCLRVGFSSFQVGFHGFFHGSRLVFWSSRLVFCGSRLVFMVSHALWFQEGFHGFSWFQVGFYVFLWSQVGFFMDPGWFFMGRFSWFLMALGWFFTVPDGFSWFFHCSRLVFWGSRLVFLGSRLVFSGSRLVSWFLMLHGSRKVFIIQAHATQRSMRKYEEQLFTLAEVSSFIVHFVEIRKGLKVAKTHQNRPRLSAFVWESQIKILYLFRFCPTKHLF